MEIKKIKKEVTEIFVKNLKRDNITLNNDYLLLKITEEIGELVQAYLIYTKQCRPVKYVDDKIAKKELAKELSDVISLSLVISEVLNIDIEEAIQKKWISREWIKA